MQLSTRVIFEGPGGTTIDVIGQCSYRLVFHADEAHIIAPGLDKTITLDEEVYPMDDLEACAVMVVAQLEGGVEL